VLKDYTYRLLISRVDLVDLCYFSTTFESWLFLTSKLLFVRNCDLHVVLVGMQQTQEANRV